MTTAKAEGAFRTIREVADWLGVPTHVLRFWESKFDVVAPVKGAGGRRYYRPEDMRLLGGIKVLLHDQGQTIRGVVQRIADEGADEIMALSPAFEGETGAAGRTRRVIRSGGDEAAGSERRPVGGRLTLFPDGGAAASAEGAEPAGDRTAEPSERDAAARDREAAPAEDAVADDAIPDDVDTVDAPDDADPLDDQPTEPGSDRAAPGRPRDPGQPEPGTAPGGPPPAPAEPREVAPEDPFDGGPAPEPDDGAPAGPDPMEAPPLSSQPVPPSLAALRLAHRARRDGRTVRDRRRLRRVLRRLRNLAGEIEEDLAGDG